MMYTVVGFYNGTWLRYVSHVNVESPSLVVKALAERYPDESIAVVAVFEGELTDQLDGDYPVDTDEVE